MPAPRRAVWCAPLLAAAAAPLPAVGSGSWDHTAARERLYEAYATYCGDAPLQRWDCYWCRRAAANYTVVAVAEGKLNAKGYVARTAGRVLVALRGTKATSVTNWVEDADFLKRKFTTNGAPQGAEVHRGLQNTYLQIQDQVIAGVRQATAQCPGCEVVVTGHSLGAAMALYAALDLKTELGLSPKVTTFGLPRPGNKVFATFWDQTVETSGEYTHWRVVNGHDTVTDFPPAAMGFVHPSHEVWERPAGSTTFTLCGEPSYSCRDGIGYNPYDHLTYMGENLIASTAVCMG